MAIPWGTLKSLIIFFGPMLLPRIIAQYRQLKAEARRREQSQNEDRAWPTRPLSVRSAVVLGLLAGVAVGYLLSAGLVPDAIASLVHLPPALRQPENIFVATQSRLQAPTDVLFTRLAALRPNRVLTAADEALRQRMASLESRLLYLQFGPAAIADCPFCGGTGVDASSGFSATSFLYYAAVDLVALHLTNLVLIAIVTSPLLLLGRRGKPSSSSSSVSVATGPTGADRAYDVSAAHISRCRGPASVLALCLGALDLYMVSTYNRSANARATRLAELDLFFWTMRTYRGVACGLLLGALAAVLYWAATGLHSSPRLGLLGVVLFGAPPPLSPAHRVTATTRALAGVKSKLSAGAILKNTVLRDVGLRGHSQAYWTREVMLVAEAMEEREVIEGINDALQNRIDIQKIERDAESYAQNVVPSLPARPLGTDAEEQQQQQQRQQRQQQQKHQSQAEATQFESQSNMPSAAAKKRQ